MMKKGMSQQEAQGLLILVAIVVIAVCIIVLKIKIGIIHFFQNLFWIALAFVPILLLGVLCFGIWGILKREEYYSEFFSRGVIFLFAGGLFLLSLASLVVAGYSYERGYSPEALDKLAKYEDQLASLQQLQSVLTGEIIWEIQNQIIEETITSLCNDPNYPCETTKQSYRVYKNIKGAKDQADSVANFLGFIKKAEEKVK